MTGAYAIQRVQRAIAIFCHSATIGSECHFANATKAPFTEPTPNRAQSVLADYAEVRRRKTEGQRGFGG